MMRMKVICIDKKYPDLTIGKEYDATSRSDSDNYMIQHESDNSNYLKFGLFSKSSFMTLSEYRSKRLEEIGI
jgi:hypothetical protein